MDISVIVPVYNEVENVERLCAKLHAALVRIGRTYEIILVDDGSRDGTWEKLKEQASSVPHLRLIRLRRNFGQTAAMSAGMHQAKGEVMVTLDADLQNDPDDIPLLLERMDRGFDVVSGWRKDRKDPFINRRLPSIIANALISRVTGVPIHDFGCTLKAYRREVLENVQLYGEMHRFIPALASWVGGTVDEVVVRHSPREFGKSKYGLSRIVRVVLDLFTVSFLLRYSRSPIQIFGRIGLILGLPGLLMLTWMVLANLSYHVFGTHFAAELLKRPFWVMTSFMLIFFGIQFVSMGILAELQIRTYHESQGKKIYVIKEILEPKEPV
ncbi:MAG: glycosyltransferase family 2 protein [Verrucomicrobia bacterium]|nr:glycosyltransferase family 2 protein [Verrucomicrobiota bacterium]MBU1734636.1 glycosyltransferase family 2 protein [Verrucomicrobiota bacterium]MBU1858033.1 glycosyltransferase family 2 protein [Verrucomicrobiota bacterium]